jgi:hypothetical protein
MVASHAPLRRPPPTEVGIAAGFVHDAQVIEDAGRRLQDLLTDPERLVTQRQNFPDTPDTDAGYLIAQAAAALCNLMDLSFPTSGRIRLEQPVRFCEIRIGDHDNRLVLSSWWPAEL